MSKKSVTRANSEMDLTQDILFGAIREVYPELYRGTNAYELFERVSKTLILESPLNDEFNGQIELPVVGSIQFPYVKMGAIDTLHLFGLDELIIFAFYMANKDRYSRTADIGANLGLHTIIMSKCGWRVDAFEPDPKHVALLKGNLVKNSIDGVQVFENAVADREDEREFVRVLGNTTGSHLAGFKASPYGELDTFNVKVLNINSIIEDYDFIKMDVEGAEADIVSSLSGQVFDNVDIMLEIGNDENASAIFDWAKREGVNVFTQKSGWNVAQSLSDMPVHHKEGSVFLSQKRSMPW